MMGVSRNPLRNKFPKPGKLDAGFELRFDAGEVVDGKKTVYLQFN